MILKREDGMVWSGFIWLRTGACDINKHSVSTKSREFLAQLESFTMLRRTLFQGVG